MLVGGVRVVDERIPECTVLWITCPEDATAIAYRAAASQSGFFSIWNLSQRVRARAGRAESRQRPRDLLSAQVHRHRLERVAALGHEPDDLGGGISGRAQRGDARLGLRERDRR